MDERGNICGIFHQQGCVAVANSLVAFKMKYQTDMIGGNNATFD